MSQPYRTPTRPVVYRQVSTIDLVFKAIGAFIAALAISFAVDLLLAVVVTWMLSIAHNIDPRVPDLKYWATFFVMLAFSTMLSAAGVAKSKS